MKAIILFFTICILQYTLVFSQTTLYNNDTTTSSISNDISFIKEIPKEGTYQIIYKSTESIPTIDNEILLTVNEKRKAEEVEYIIVDEQTKIKILPYSIIYAKDFVPLATYIIE